MTDSFDAVVVGAGPNGLVAANRLADAGWSVLVLEEQPTPGGAVRSDRDVHPEFVHDTFSSFYPLAAASPAIGSLRLEEHGLVWRHAPAVLGHPTPDGSWALLHRDRDVTAALLDQQKYGDGAAWLDLCRTWDRVGDTLVDALLTPFPPLRASTRLLACLRDSGGMSLVRTLLTPAAELGRTRFTGVAPRLLIAGSAGHSDIPLDSPGSGMMGLLMTMLGQTVGFPAPQGGAGALTTALVRRLRARGGTLVCDTPVRWVDVDRGRVTGVRTAAGETVAVHRAVVADVLASDLYRRLLREEDVPAQTLRAVRDFRLDPSTIKVDWALDGAIPWDPQPLYAPGTFHLSDSMSQLTESLQQLSAGLVPAQPFLLGGQMTTTDPTRSPLDTESVWAYSHVPQEIAHDAGDDELRGRWDHDELERFADRMERRIEERAPGFGARVRARRVLGPRELEARDANLAGGAINGGTAQLHQQAFFRPIPGTGRAETPIRGLFLGSASAHPGGGVHGAAGMNAARAAMAYARTAYLSELPRRVVSAALRGGRDG